MKFSSATIFLIVVTLSVFSSCQAIGDIFKTGVWFGVIAVIAIILLVVYSVTRSKS